MKVLRDVFTSVVFLNVFLRSIFYPNQNIYIGLMLGLNALLFSKAQLCSKLESFNQSFHVCGSQRCLFLFLEAATSWDHHPSAIICHRCCVRTQSHAAVLHRHVLRCRCWAAEGGGWLSRRRSAASLATISVSKIQNKETWAFLLSRGLFKTKWSEFFSGIILSAFTDKSKEPPPQLIDEPLFQSSPGNSHSDVMSRFLPVRQGQQWEGGWGLHHIIFPQRGRPAAYSCLMAPSCHMASQAAATQERQMLWLHKDL